MNTSEFGSPEAKDQLIEILKSQKLCDALAEGKLTISYEDYSSSEENNIQLSIKPYSDKDQSPGFFLTLIRIVVWTFAFIGAFDIYKAFFPH